MAENSSSSQMTTLTTIPFEILLLILRELDTIDVIHLGMTCRDLYESTQTHHVWLDQTQNHRRRTVALKLSIPSPTKLTTETLKRFAILQAKLHIRWNRLPDQHDWEKSQFTACGAILLPGRLDLIFLPGGEFVISIDDGESSISLHRIKLLGGHLSLVRLADLSRGEHDQGEVGWKKMLPAMSPHPVFSYGRANSVYLFEIRSDGKVNLESEFQIPERSNLLWVGGQGRISGFVFQTAFESPLVNVIHLDYPGITLEIQLPPDCGDSTEDRSTHAPHLGGAFEKTGTFLQAVESWKVCFPIPGLAVIYGRDRVLAYTLPSFSTLSHGKQLLDEGPIWCLPSILENKRGVRRYKTSAEVSYDSSQPDHRFNIHLLYRLGCLGPSTYMGLITLNIDPFNPSPPSLGTPTHQRIASRFPITGLTAMGTLHPGIYHSRTHPHNEGLDVWVTPLEDLSSSQACGDREGRGSLWMFVSNDELEPDLEWESVDLDEASGRVFIWGPTYRWRTPCETRIFVGELVS
ncbi:hypothetical protein BDM02DRAFT_3115600 [Thelephora ganbajun]|uniref:Uncharacterized protein n=1 Tax=Thelephora ganbajun TaxID=370292 RepID=A0ACB6ZFF6_THEGA|nr:hypothetical protein BDM02DRAFT_3115600 [Thelephora ganbajun]